MGLNWSTLHSPANYEGPEMLACWRVADDSFSALLDAGHHRTIEAVAYPRRFAPAPTDTVGENTRTVRDEMTRRTGA